MSATTATERMTITSPTPPSTPRLRMDATGSRRTLLDGAWWQEAEGGRIGTIPTRAA